MKFERFTKGKQQKYENKNSASSLEAFKDYEL